jgi:methyl-accepting chemotaxis protein
MLVSVGGATGASQEALNNCEVVAAAGEELSVSAREIARQITASTVEVASTVRAGAQAHQIIGQLSASMRQIGSVAKVIGDIAGRTNLLALNATIEAARAGEAGRGFAVVAGEVKSLATLTAQSTEEIARTVRSIETATHDAVKAVDEMVERVAAIERITDVVATAAEQQTAATREIARSVMSTAASMRVVSEQIELVTEEAHSTETAVTDIQSAAGTVFDQIAVLGTVMVRIVRTSSDAANRRSDKRIPLNLPAALILDGREIQAECVDLSRGGARVNASQNLVSGTIVILRMAGLPDLSATVIEGGEHASLRFAGGPEGTPAPLSDFLDRQAA